MRGKVKWYNEKKGYGFIETEEGESLFVTFSGIQGRGWRTLRIDEAVAFDVETRGEVRCAVNVVSIEEFAPIERLPEKDVAVGSVWWLEGILVGDSHNAFENPHPHVILDIPLNAITLCARSSLDCSREEFAAKHQKRPEYCVFTDANIIHGLEKAGVFDVSIAHTLTSDEIKKLCRELTGQLPKIVAEELTDKYVRFMKEGGWLYNRPEYEALRELHRNHICHVHLEKRIVGLMSLSYP